ncbi:MAG: long-chain fatty acid--CoA ligase [bacterium]
MLTGQADFIEQWARVAPWRVALREVETGRMRRYGELSARSWRLVHALAAQGVMPGDRVVLLARNGVETFELLIACLRLGAAFTPLNWRLAAAELGDIIDRCRPGVLVYDDPSAAAAEALLAARKSLHGIALGAPVRDGDGIYEDLLAHADDTPALVARDPEAIAMLLYTSGTTGKPKGVMLPHRQIFWNAINTVYACDLSPADKVLAFLPLFHTGGLNCLATPTLYRGGMVALMSAFDAGLSLRTIEDWRITATVAVPTMYHMLLDAGLDRYDTRSLTTILCGGAPLPDALLDAWLGRGFAFRQGFGMTEVGPNCFSLPPWKVGQKRGSVGQPVLHAAARILDDDGRILGPGEVGELCLGGPHVCRGYFEDEAATAEALRDGWFHTGDQARYDEDGFYYVAGRKKDMFISGGENVYPAEIENVILSLSGVAEVAVVALPDDKWGEVGAAALVFEPGVAIDADMVAGWCRERLARFKVPKRYVVVEELPKNASGKVIKPAVRARLLGG